MGPVVPASQGLEEAQRSLGSSEDRKAMGSGGGAPASGKNVPWGQGVSRQCTWRAERVYMIKGAGAWLVIPSQLQASLGTQQVPDTYCGLALF